MSERAERAKAQITEAKTDISDADRCITLGISPAAGTLHRRLREVTAALTASEAEVTRLETGIAEAPHSYSCISKTPSKATDCDCWKAALSQPTTDTNGAHA